MDNLICGCIRREAEPLLVDILRIYDNVSAYNNSNVLKEIIKKYGEPQVCLILNLLNEMKYIQHSGSLISSSSLTFQGTELACEYGIGPRVLCANCGCHVLRMDKCQACEAILHCTIQRYVHKENGMVGALLWCGDKECNCWVPVIWDDSGKEIWRGMFIEGASLEQIEGLRDQLAQRAIKLGRVTIVADVTYNPEKH